jgi:hypothetical protein
MQYNHGALILFNVQRCDLVSFWQFVEPPEWVVMQRESVVMCS